MIVKSHEVNEYKLFLNGFFNTFNINQNEFESEIAENIHEIINFSKQPEHVDVEHVDSVIKEPFTVTNLMLNSSINDSNYVIICKIN